MVSCSTGNLLAVFTVSPKRQYLGILLPTTPDTTGPVWIPILGSPETVFVVRDRFDIRMKGLHVYCPLPTSQVLIDYIPQEQLFQGPAVISH